MLQELEVQVLQGLVLGVLVGLALAVVVGVVVALVLVREWEREWAERLGTAQLKQLRQRQKRLWK